MRAPHGPHEVAAFYVVAEALTNAAKHSQASEVGIRAIAHPKVANDSERSARAWLFTVARNMIIDERRSLRFRYEVSTLAGLDTTEPASPNEANAALDRLLIVDALARLTPEHRAVIRRSYFLAWTTAQIAADLRIADGTVKSRLHSAVGRLWREMCEMGFTP